MVNVISRLFIILEILLFKNVMNSNQTLMLCCLPYASDTVQNYLFMCVFPLEDDLHGSSFVSGFSKFGEI